MRFSLEFHNFMTTQDFVGTLSPDRLFVKPGGPTDEPEDWALWLLMHYLPDRKGTFFTSPGIVDCAFTMLPGFLHLAQIPEPTAAIVDRNWAIKGKTVFRNGDKTTHDIGLPFSCLGTAPLAQDPPKVFTCNGTLHLDDMACVQMGLIMGLLDQSPALDANHPALVLLALLGVMDLPRAPFFPNRSGSTAWRSLFSDTDAPNPWVRPLIFGLKNRLLIGNTMVAPKTFLHGPAWDPMDEKTTGGATRTFGRALVDISLHAAVFLSSIRDTVTLDALFDLYDPDRSVATPSSLALTAHDRVAIKQLTMAVTAAYAHAGPLNAFERSCIEG